METFNIYQDIAERTGGDIYIGVVGPVRTGKIDLYQAVYGFAGAAAHCKHLHEGAGEGRTAAIGKRKDNHDDRAEICAE